MNLRERKSKWTQIYFDSVKNEAGKVESFYYVRLVPDFMDTEAAGSSHGLAISGRLKVPTRNDDDQAWGEACHLADFVDSFMDNMLKDFFEVDAEEPEKQILQNAIEKHLLDKLKDMDQVSLLALIRYAKHVGYNEGYQDAKHS